MKTVEWEGKSGGYCPYLHHCPTRKRDAQKEKGVLNIPHTTGATVSISIHVMILMGFVWWIIRSFDLFFLPIWNAQFDYLMAAKKMANRLFLRAVEVSDTGPVEVSKAFKGQWRAPCGSKVKINNLPRAGFENHAHITHPRESDCILSHFILRVVFPKHILFFIFQWTACSSVITVAESPRFEFRAPPINWQSVKQK